MGARDRVRIRDLRVQAIVGVDGWERETPQEIRIDLTAFADLAPAGRSDQLADAIDYRALSGAIRRYAEGSRHFLLEALAAGLAELTLRDFGAERVRVRLAKPGALPGVGSVGIEIVRGREDLDPERP